MCRAKVCDLLDGLLFCSPFILGVLLFWIGPMLYSVFLTTQDWNLIRAPRFIALGNIERLLSDPLVGKSLLVTAYFTFVGVPLQLITAFSLALMLNQGLRGQGFYRTIYYLPAITPAVASAVVATAGLCGPKLSCASLSWEEIVWRSR